MAVPTRACFWCHISFNKVRDDFAVGGVGDAQVAVEEKVAQSAAFPFDVFGFEMGKLCRGAVQHGALLWVGDVALQHEA